MSREDRDGDRPRPSWREIDRMRDRGGRRDSARPRGAAAEARAREATRQYVKKLDALFSGAGGGDETRALEAAVRAAHGTPGLSAACRAYLDAFGTPRDASLLSIFLDAGDREIALAALAGLRSLREAGDLALGSGLRSQLGLLAGGPDDALADAAEELLADS